MIQPCHFLPLISSLGRNFNNGEVIQLVLRSPSSGHWLPFKFVQMVMIHELAHNKQMNHSKHFWAVRNEFAAEMKGLWDKEYTGEGLWGRGVLLDNGAFAREGLEEGETLPDHLCGGGFRSREKKKPRPKITYRERRERRERKMNAKYGSGMALGGDEETRIKLEKGKRPLSNPKRANTARGRELRAAAALARFEPKKEFESKQSDDDLVTDSEAENGGEYGNMIKSEPDDAVDMNGKPILDTQGRHMVRICKEDDKDDEYAKRELWELQNMNDSDIGEKISHHSSFNNAKLNSMPETAFKSPERSVIEDEKKPSSTIRSEQQSKKSPPVTQDATSSVGKAPETHGQRVNGLSCPTCSFGNEFTALTCSVCANVLQPDAILNSWRCDSTTCSDSKYINSGDVGLCGVCGAKKCSS